MNILASLLIFATGYILARSFFLLASDKKRQPLFSCPKCSGRFYEVLCPSCGFRFPASFYLLLAVFTAVNTGFYSHFEIKRYFAYNYTFSVIFLYISVYDLKKSIVPDGSVIMLAAAGILALFLFSDYNLYPMTLLSSAGGLAAGFGIMLVLSLISGVEMGGDIKLAAALGILSGYQNILFIILYASFMFAFVSLVMRKKITDKMPFAPYMIMAYYLWYALPVF